jgi:hypothetical protein
VIALETVDHDKEVDTYEACLDLWLLTTATLFHPVFRNFLASFDHTDELLIVVDSVALFKDYGSECHVGLVESTGRDPQATILLFGLLLTLFQGEPGVGLTDVLVFVFREECKVRGWDYLP